MDRLIELIPSLDRRLFSETGLGDPARDDSIGKHEMLPDGADAQLLGLTHRDELAASLIRVRFAEAGIDWYRVGVFVWVDEAWFRERTFGVALSILPSSAEKPARIANSYVADRNGLEWRCLVGQVPPRTQLITVDNQTGLKSPKDSGLQGFYVALLRPSEDLVFANESGQAFEGLT